MNILEICIPTFNRGDKLNIVLEKLCLLIKEKNIRITILDNKSDETEFIKYSFWPKKNNKIQIIRNKANIGLPANINRCFEVASAEWVWVLGDDDLPDDKAIDEIFKVLNYTKNNVGVIKFSSKYDGGESVKKCENLDEILKNYGTASQFANLLFISTTIFRRELYLKNMGLAYKYSHTLAPHIAVILNGISPECTLVKYDFILVENSFDNSKTSWKHIDLLVVIRELSEISKDKSIGKFIDKIYDLRLFKAIRTLVFIVYSNADEYLSRDKAINLIGEKTLFKTTSFLIIYYILSINFFQMILVNTVRRLKKWRIL